MVGVLFIAVATTWLKNEVGSAPPNHTGRSDSPRASRDVLTLISPLA